MLINKIGNILEAPENIICHQVNEDGIMGGGLALQIATQYPEVELEYRNFTKNFDSKSLYGQFLVSRIGNSKYIANCYTQRNYKTNLDDIRLAFTGLLESCRIGGLSIAIPYKYGCGIANGNWEEVEKLFQELSEQCKVDINVYKLEEV